MNALELARSDRTWDVCILDIGLPDMTGYELAGQLRLLPGTGGATLIALTGYGQAHDRVISKTAGFSHHLVKPADIRQLLDILDGVGISSGRSQGTSGS